ncbi:c-type cytochrome [Kriegella sp. EG-1]|nr:c-type cytochrome [Flavobacteriaceae bacterium EG-1]
MKKFLFVLALGGLMISCGGKEKKEEKEGFEINRKKTESKAAEVQESVPVDLDNKGVGPIKSVTFDDTVNEELAAKGGQTFNTICIACHALDKRMIGPALSGVYERRSPEWVMNMILNPDVMLKEDPIAKALLKEYNNAVMLNQNLSEEDARAVVEFLRNK